MKHLTFLASMGPYREGDTASFDDKKANKLLEMEPAIVEEVTLESTKLNQENGDEESRGGKKK